MFNAANGAAASVTLDGTRTAGATTGFSPQGDRAPLIDQVPSELIKEIEITKGNTPDQSADSLGGTVNLVTKSAFDFKQRVITYRLGLNLNTYRDGDFVRDDHGAFRLEDEDLPLTEAEGRIPPSRRQRRLH